MQYLLQTIVLLTFASCAADVSDACTCELASLTLSNANDAGVREGNFLDVLTDGCSAEGVSTPLVACDHDSYTVECAGDTLHFRLADAATCEVELVR